MFHKYDKSLNLNLLSRSSNILSILLTPEIKKKSYLDKSEWRMHEEDVWFEKLGFLQRTYKENFMT